MQIHQGVIGTFDSIDSLIVYSQWQVYSMDRTFLPDHHEHQQ